MSPTVRVPPTSNVVCICHGTLVTKGIAGRVAPICRVSVPPPLPVRMTGGLLKQGNNRSGIGPDIKHRRSVHISKAEQYHFPVDDLDPSG